METNAVATVSTTVSATAVKNDKLVINPLTMTLATNTLLSACNDTYQYEHEIQRIKNDLIRSELNTYANVEQNHEYLVLIQDIVDKLPILPNIEQQKLNVPEFEEIEVLKTDTVEIKKFIRKMNLEFVGYYCNHKVADKECDMVFKNTADIYNSKEYCGYIEFLRNLASYVWSIRDYDCRGKEWKDSYMIPTPKVINQIINDLIKLAGNIKRYNALMNPECSRCRAEVKKYNYVVKEVKRMRDENEEIKRIREEITNNNIIQKPLTVADFIREKFDGIDKFKLSEVKESYKKLYNITKTFDELKKEIEDTGEYKITNCSRTYMVSKL